MIPISSRPFSSSAGARFDILFTFWCTCQHQDFLLWMGWGWTEFPTFVSGYEVCRDSRCQPAGLRSALETRAHEPDVVPCTRFDISASQSRIAHRQGVILRSDTHAGGRDRRGNDIKSRPLTWVPCFAARPSSSASVARDNLCLFLPFQPHPSSGAPLVSDPRQTTRFGS